MKREMDKIKFESRREIEDVMGAIEELAFERPEGKKGKVLKELYNQLEVMYMEW